MECVASQLRYEISFSQSPWPVIRQNAVDPCLNPKGCVRACASVHGRVCTLGLQLFRAVVRLCLGFMPVSNWPPTRCPWAPPLRQPRCPGSSFTVGCVLPGWASEAPAQDSTGWGRGACVHTRSGSWTCPGIWGSPGGVGFMGWGFHSCPWTGASSRPSPCPLCSHLCWGSLLP